MKPPKSHVFAKRRYHTAGNEKNGRWEKLRWHRQNDPPLLLGSTFLFGIPSLVIFVYVSGFEGASDWLLLLLPFLIMGTFASYMFYESANKLRKEYDVRGQGYWIIGIGGLIHYYGCEKRRFLPWNEITGVHLSPQKTQIFLETQNFPETTNEPLVISSFPHQTGDNDTTPFLPFLNKLIGHLEPLGFDLTELRKLQAEWRKADIRRTDFPSATNCEFIIGILVPLITAYSTMLFSVLVLEKVIESEFLYLGIMICLAGLFLVSAFVGIRLYRWAKEKTRQKVEKRYREILDPQEPETKPSEKSVNFQPPPRTVTPAAKRRLCFGWMVLINGILAIFLLFLMFCVPEPNLRKYNALYGLFVIFAFGFFGFVLVFGEWSMGKMYIDLLEKGTYLVGRFRKIGSYRITVEAPPGSKQFYTMSNEKEIRRTRLGEKAVLIVDPDKPKRYILQEQITRAISYDPETNTFDSRSRLPVFRWPLGVVSVVAAILWFYLFVREILVLYG